MTAVAVALCLSCLLLLLADCRDRAALILGTDYLEFYVAGHMARTGNFDQVYLPASATEMGNAGQITYAARLNELDAAACLKTPIVFSYPPFVALAFAPLSMLPFKTSLIVWQLISLGALMCCCILFSKIKPSPETVDVVRERPLVLFVISFTLLNVVQTLILGQTTFVFGLLPFAAALYLFSVQRPAAAGLALSWLSLKPQIFICAGTIMSVMLLAGFRQPKLPDGAFSLRSGILTAASAVAGTAVLHLTPLLVQGDLVWRWLHQVYLLNHHLYGPHEYLYTSFDLASLWSTLAMVTPIAWRSDWRLPAQIGAATLLITQLAVMWKTANNAKLNQGEKLDFLTLTALSYLPLTALYLCSYDYSILLLSGFIVMTRRRQPDSRSLFLIMLVVLTTLDGFFLSMPFTITHGLVKPAMILLQIVLGAACFFVSLYMCKSAGKKADGQDFLPVEQNR